MKTQKKKLQELRTRRCLHRKEAAFAQQEYEELCLEPTGAGCLAAIARRNAKIKLMIAIERSRGSKIAMRRMEERYKELQTGLTS